MKYLILVGDGMGGLPLEELGGKTTLEAAATPEMDRLCRSGRLYLASTVPEGYPPGSDVANLSLMGYDPVKYYTGRAPLEAAAMGLSLADDETAFRCNLICLDKRGETDIEMVDFSAGHISTEEAHELIKGLNSQCDKTRFSFHPGVSYRHLLIVKGDLPGFTTHPPHDYIEKDVYPFYSAYFDDPSWSSLMKMAEEVLRNHPVNTRRRDQGKTPATAIWPWGEGKMPTMPTLTERFGITGGVISAVDLLKGLGVNAGLSVINVPGATGFIDTNYLGKADAALKVLQDSDFVFVHVEAPDESGHQGSIKNKIMAIEDFDQKIVRHIIEDLDTRKIEYRVVVTMDHFTPISLRTHVSDPVPALLFDSRNPTGGSGLPFSERSSRQKDSVEIVSRGHELINILLEQPCK